MTVRLSAAAYAGMLAFAERGLPNEVCGLIAGEVRGDVKIVRRVYPLSNLDASPTHFSIDPKEQLAAVRDMRAGGLIPLGNFHSHPNTPARLSPEDIRLARDPQASYLILSLSGRPALKSFHIERACATEETLEIV
ncbi:MAG: M67 family metallopeptidase [Clostridiales Family XIII bacterium]|nr:M67 family metallopeptidase [Clostridiales Family XIII bacterium]